MALTEVRSAALDLAVGLDGDQISVVLADLRLARLGRRLGTPAVNVAHPVGPADPGALCGVPVLGQEPDPRAEGRTTKEIRRCLKRYLARQIYRILNAA